VKLKLLIFALRDSCAEYYTNPIYARTRAEAIRSLGLAVNDGQSDIGGHPEHFSLFELGSFDPENGRIEVHALPVGVISALDLKAAPPVAQLKVVGDV